MVLRVWTMVEANLRSSSRSRMSAIEWKMFSAFSRRQSCLEDRHKTRVTETRASTQKPTPWPCVLRKQGPYWAWCGTPAPRPVRGHRDSQWLWASSSGAPPAAFIPPPCPSSENGILRDTVGLWPPTCHGSPELPPSCPPAPRGPRYTSPPLPGFPLLERDYLHVTRNTHTGHLGTALPFPRQQELVLFGLPTPAWSASAGGRG